MKLLKDFSKKELADLQKGQKIMTNMLKEFDNICRTNGLKYWCIGGTLIGAVRHKGWIPHDTDIDVAMLKSDYEQLQNIIQKKLSKDYWFQDKSKDKYYKLNIGKIRYLYAQYDDWKDESWHNGLQLDIFPNTLKNGILTYTPPIPYHKKLYSYNLIFPLKEMVFEGIKVYVPNQVEKYCRDTWRDYQPRELSIDKQYPHEGRISFTIPNWMKVKYPSLYKKKMKLVILNAGVGSRLKKITENKPKCLLNLINGYKTLLENQLMIFSEFEILLVLGYKSDMIIDIIKDYKNVKYIVNENYNTTNNMYSINLAKEFVGDHSFFVLNGDIYIEKEILNVIKSMDLNCNSIFTEKNNFNDENMKVKVVDSYIVDIDKKLTASESNGLSMDFYYIKDTTVYFKEIEDYLLKEKNHWAELILKKMMKYTQFKPVYNNVFWYEIDTINDYIDYINKKNKFKNYDNYFLDIDGNLLLNSKLINNADLFLKRINNFKLITNNSSKTKQTYQNIFNSYGISINENDIINSIDSTIHYLNEKNMKNIYLFSTKEVKKIFENNNFNIHDIDNINEIDLVVITYNTEYHYKDLIKLFTVIKEKDYIVTHMDQICPYENFYIPDVGCLIDNIYSCLNKKPLAILGKPNINISFSGTALVIGDNLDTDYQQSVNSNADFCLTLTGRTKIEDLEKKISKLKKINVVKSINDIKIN